MQGPAAALRCSRFMRWVTGCQSKLMNNSIGQFTLDYALRTVNKFVWEWFDFRYAGHTAENELTRSLFFKCCSITTILEPMLIQHMYNVSDDENLKYMWTPGCITFKTSRYQSDKNDITSNWHILLAIIIRRMIPLLKTILTHHLNRIHIA